MFLTMLKISLVCLRYSTCEISLLTLLFLTITIIYEIENGKNTQAKE